MKSVTYKGLKMGARLMEMEKTNRMNALFEFYSTLLTEKQMNYMELYYADDFSLGEIAEEYEVSRQAVYDGGCTSHTGGSSSRTTSWRPAPVR